MNVSELRSKTVEELKVELLSLKREQFNLRMQKATGQLAKPHLVAQARKDVARIKMIISEKTKGA